MIEKKDIIFFLPNFNQGGAGNSILKISNGLDRKKYYSTIICLGKCFYKKQFKKDTKIFELDNYKTLFSFLKIIRLMKKKYPKKNSIFVSNINYANALSCIFVKIFLKYKLILIERTPLKELYTYYNFKDYLKKKVIFILMKNFYKYSNLVILNSKFTENIFKKKILCKTTSIYSPSIDKINHNKLRKDKHFIKSQKLKILTIGRLSIEKRLDFLINSVKHIRKNIQQVYIVGNGPQYLNLVQLINQHNLNDIIKVKKFDKNYKNYFNKSKLYINTSDFEGFPNSVVEALNHNLYVISRDSGGGIHNILLNGKIGKIINTDSPKKFGAAIIKFCRDIKYYSKNKKLIKKNLENYKTEKIIKKFNDIFSNKNL